MENISLSAQETIKVIGMVASLTLPLFNIPLVLKMRRRKSSKDLSLTWATGVWICILFMTPAALLSSDTVFKVFGVGNLIFFSIVVFYALKYR